jgi:periplasmic protein TonB
MKITVLLFGLAALLAPSFLFAAPDAPVPIRVVNPDYPEALKREGTSGIVVVSCNIDDKGNVTEAKVEKASNPAFEKPALAAIVQWRFKPARENGAAVAITVQIPIKFLFAD